MRTIETIATPLKTWIPLGLQLVLTSCSLEPRVLSSPNEGVDTESNDTVPGFGTQGVNASEDNTTSTGRLEAQPISESPESESLAGTSGEDRQVQQRNEGMAAANEDDGPVAPNDEMMDATNDNAPQTDTMMGEAPNSPSGPADNAPTCLDGTNPCAPGGECIPTGGTRYECSCDSGFENSSVSEPSGESFPRCLVIDECALNQHGCGTFGGSCLGGEAIGYDCSCEAGFTLREGEFPDCFQSGEVTLFFDLNDTTRMGFDFTLAEYGDLSGGDFYMSTEDIDNPAAGLTFLANNIGQRGIARVENPPEALFDVRIPPQFSYAIFGVPVVTGGVYVSLAEETQEEPAEDGYVIVFRVLQSDTTSARLQYVYLYRPESLE